MRKTLSVWLCTISKQREQVSHIALINKIFIENISRFLFCVYMTSSDRNWIPEHTAHVNAQMLNERSSGAT
jgi:hypothetical protein